MPDYRDMFDDYPEQAPLWAATFATNVSDFTALAPIIIPAFDPHLEWGPCRWQTRDSVNLPRKGDTCIVAFDSNREPWVIAWWPFG